MNANVSTTIAGSSRRAFRSRGESRIARRKVENTYRTRKRGLDLFLCLVVLPFAAPVILVCAIMVKVSSRGPLLFVQDRTGAGGRRFKMYKFRTMVPDAASLKEGIRAANKMGGPDFKVENDPRVTRVGSLLRKTSLDEVPQLFNIFKGDMSFVGPRPTSFDADTYDLWETERLEVLPGLTGLWQISGRAEIDFDSRVRLDIAYVRNRSMALDLSILFRTIPAVLSQHGAY